MTRENSSLRLEVNIRTHVEGQSTKQMGQRPHLIACRRQLHDALRHNRYLSSISARNSRRNKGDLLCNAIIHHFAMGGIVEHE
ncbi:hypothetical protein BS17DRAFT_781289 [Gyrodon lividus]|nr:hypothetical protein BS17DRAFT_781289 [Gyrodon lividus]